MTDIYLRRGREPRKGPVRLVLILLGVVAAGVLLWSFAARKAGNRADRAVPAKEVKASEETGAKQQPVRPAPVEAASPAPEPAVSPAAAPVPTAAGTDPALRLLSEARALLKEDELVEARKRCYRILDQSANPRITRSAEDLLGEVNTQLVMTPRKMPEKIDYTIQRGDSLDRIASKHKTTVELLRTSNNIKGSTIRYGDWLRIFTGTFSVKVSKGRNEMEVYCNDKFFKRYRVGTGKFGRTPIGHFKIKDKITHPPWWRPDGKQIPYGSPENELGTHWMSLESLENPSLRGYGIHGTWEPETIGHQASAGCVRLLNEEVEELYTLLPRGTGVEITE